MRKLLLILVVFSFFGCEKEENSIIKNELLETVWMSGDEFADIVWGGNNKQYYEFLNDTEVQYHKTHNGTVKDLEKGTYNFVKPDLTILIDGDTKGFEISGSLMISKGQKVPSGGYLTFTK